MTISTWAKIGGICIFSVACFLGGYQVAAALYGRDIAQLREDYATRAKELESKYRKKVEENAKAVVAAWEERDRAISSASDLSDELGRVRIEADRTRRELSRTNADSCNTVRAELSTCTSLLERSAELLARGSRLAQDTAADKDAIVKMTK